MIAEALTWWVVVEAIGLVATPMALVVFGALPGKGYAFTKPLGLLLAGYLFWMALTLHVLPNRPGSVFWVLVIVAGVSFWLYRRNQDEMRAYLREHWGHVLAVEVVFAATFFTAGHLRSFIPEIIGTEKPMDFMFLNAVDRSRYYPPADPWLAGFDVSYYYFGYVIQAMTGKLASLPSAVTFNLALCGTAALAATTAFGLAYELARFARHVTTEAAVIVGGVALVLVVLMGNLEGALEFGVANGYDIPDSVIQRIDIANLESAQASSSCIVQLPGQCLAHPDERSSFWWWWRATRISPDANSITEFPFFSFMLGDLHPHVMSIPFVFTVVALGLALWRSYARLNLQTWRDKPWLLLIAALMLGGLGFLNAWDLPTLAFLLALLAFVRNLTSSAWRLRDGEPMRYPVAPVLKETAGFVLPLLGLAVLLYLPFYLAFQTQADGFAAVSGAATKTLHSFLFWAPLFAVTLPLPLVLLTRDAWARTSSRLSTALWLPVLLLLFWSLMLVFDGGPSALKDAIADRGAGWLTTAFLSASVLVCVLALWGAIDRRAALGDEAAAAEQDAALIPILIMMTTAMLLIVGGELFYVKDVFASRLNTVFKLSYQAWLLLGVSGAWSLYWLITQWPLVKAGDAPQTLYSKAGDAPHTPPKGQKAGLSPNSWRFELGRGAWAATVTLVLGAAMLYPLGATLSRTEGLAKPQRTLDGLAFARRETPDDVAAVEWLRDHAGPGERLVEATGQQYTASARAAGWSGVPSVIGWAGHEVQWGRDETALGTRQAEVDQAYSTGSLAEALSILRKYDVTYVFIGSVERAKYPAPGLEKFEGALTAAFQFGRAAVYRLPIDLSEPAVNGQ